MKGLNQLIIMLYPKVWRQRYREEFQALLEQVPSGWRPSLDVLWSGLATQVRTWNAGRVLAAMAIFGGVVGFCLWITVPKQYASDAVVQILPAFDQLPPDDQTAGTSVMEVAHRAWSNPKLAHIVETFGLYERVRTKAPLGDAVEIMKKAIMLRPASSRPNERRAFVVQFTYPDPAMAQQVARELVGNFMDAANGVTGPPITFSVRRPPSPSHHPVDSPGWMAILGMVAGLSVGLLTVAFRRSPKLN